MDFVLGIDFGTSYFKLSLFNRQGDLCGLGRIKVRMDTGDGSRCEVPVERFWSLLQEGLQEACQQAKAHPDQIRALSYASQANSFLLLDKNMIPLTPIILWPDDRARDIESVHALFKGTGFLQNTGLGIDCSQQFCVAKILWLQQNRPDLWTRAAHLMTLSDYFTWSLTGEAVGDAGTASLLGLLDQQTLSWRREIVDLGDLRLSTALRPGTAAGTITPAGSRQLGLHAGIPFIVGSLDHHMAALGAGVGQIADMSESTGTVLACVKFADRYVPRPNICTGTGLDAHTYYQLSFDDNGASALQAYQQNHAADLTISELEQLANHVAIGSDGLVARPNAHRYPDLQGFRNVSARHGAGHFTRAIFESTAASLVKLVQNLAGNTPPQRIVATGGGAASDLWLQIKADLLDIEWITTRALVPACMGAALLASIAAGWFPDRQSAAAEWVKIDKTFQPDPERHRLYRQWYRALEAANRSWDLTDRSSAIGPQTPAVMGESNQRR